MPDAPEDLHAQADREYGPCRAHAAELRAVRTYRPDERPDVLVHVDEDWHPGEPRQWSQDPAGGWWANVSWRQAPGATFLDTFPAERVWEDTDEHRQRAGTPQARR
ncbi:MAG: hypothetical protein Q7J48_04420 [Nocardioides sp.]|jgi:hypothetical protein|nr:hypothetical protein [Nocardioides sp.]